MKKYLLFCEIILRNLEQVKEISSENYLINRNEVKAK